MKSALKILLILIVNIVVSFSAALAALYWWEKTQSDPPPISVGEIIAPLAPNASDAGGAVPTHVIAIELEPNVRLTAIALPTEAISGVAVSDLVGESTPTPEGFVPVTRDRLVSIVSVFGMGDLNSETVRIQSNADEVVSLEGWTIQDAENNIFTFPAIQLIRKGIFIELYTRSGHTTPFELYWGQPEARWQSGETVVLRDSTGQIQSAYRIP